MAADNFAPGWWVVVTSLTRPVSAACPPNFPLFPLHYSLKMPGIVPAVEMDAQTKAPLAKGGWFGEAKSGGFRRLAGFHIGLYFKRVPAVNPSVTPPACQLPLAREPLVCTFPHRIFPYRNCLLSIPQAKIRDFCQLPFPREPLGRAAT